MKVPHDQIRQLCATVGRVVLENFDYCNRVCSFCSNAVIDRRSTRRYLPEAIHDAVLRELSAGGYSNSLAYGRYSEPLADEITVRRVESARKILPRAHLFINTNGDYLDRDLLARLFAAGLDELKVMRYLPNGRPFTTDAGARSCTALLDALDLVGELRTFEPDRIVYYEATLPWPGRMSVRSESYAARGCDRGGVLLHLAGRRRTEPCHSPSLEINIDFDGSVVPCCNMRSDAPQHQPYVLGSLAVSSLTEIYFSEAAHHVRAAVARPHPSLPPCVTCTYTYSAAPEAPHGTSAEVH